MNFQDAFAPITYHVGFIESDLEVVSNAFVGWQRELAREYDGNVSVERLSGGILDLLRRLEPLGRQNRELSVETQSSWVALFNNGFRVSDTTSRVGHLCRILSCRGLSLAIVPERERRTGEMLSCGAMKFTLFAAKPTDWLNEERVVQLLHDGDQWVFTANGSVQPFEEPEHYRDRRITRRFTAEMLERYCVALGIRLWDESFYGRNARLVRLSYPAERHSHQVTLAEARRELELD